MSKPYDMTKHLPKQGIGQPMNNRPINIDISNIPPLCCRICECPVFVPAVQLRLISALVSPTGQEQLAQTSIFVCRNCSAPFGTKKETLND